MRSFLFGSLSCLALVSSFGLGCSSKSEDPSARQDIGGYPIPDAPAHAHELSVDQYCDAKAKVSCHLDVPCCASAGMPQSEAQCMDAVRASCLDEVATEKAKGHVFDAKNAGICVLGGASLVDGCTLRSGNDAVGADARNLLSDACRAVWKGTVPAGGTCKENGDCATPDIGGAEGVCATSIVGDVVSHQCKVWNAQRDGEPCNDSFSCMRGTFCDGGTGPGTCRAFATKKRGESCGLGVSCEAGSSCRDGVCADGLGLGQSCDAAPIGCASPYYCQYAADFSRSCAEKRRIGESCRDGLDPCVDGAQCGKSGCVAIVPLGAACTESAQCDAASQACVAGVCAPRNDVGTKATCTAIGPLPPEPALTATPAPTPRILSMSRSTACVVTAGGGVTCWGTEIGGYTLTAPKAVADVTGALEVATGDGFACIRNEGGTVSCWGSGRYGELGQTGPDLCGSGSTWPCAKKPVLVPGITSAVKVVATSGRACALLADGTISCWGRHDGSTAESIVPPTTLPDIHNAVDVAVDLGSVLAVTSAGYVKQWRTLDEKPTWVMTQEGAYEQNVVAVTPRAFGLFPTIALHGDGSVSGAPAGLGAASDVATGQDFACAVTAEGSVQCWGGNTSAQLGTGETASHGSDFLSTVRGVSNATQIAASTAGNTACALTGAGVYCWGDNFNQLVGTKFGDHGPRKVL